MRESETSEPVNIMVYNCTKSMILMIQDMRDKGLTYQVIAEKMGYAWNTVNRYHRLYEKFGIEVFADDR